MSVVTDKITATIRAKAVCAWLDGLSRNDNPYTVSTRLGRRWARVWLQAYSSAEHGVCCDACSRWLSKDRGYHYVYSNGFNYFLCTSCQITDVKPPDVANMKVAVK